MAESFISGLEKCNDPKITPTISANKMGFFIFLPTHCNNNPLNKSSSTVV